MAQSVIVVTNDKNEITQDRIEYLKFNLIVVHFYLEGTEECNNNMALKLATIASALQSATIIFEPLNIPPTISLNIECTGQKEYSNYNACVR